jgi:hypothetical protein
MSYSSRSFPWQSVERGQGFFVPCLDVEKVRKLGLNEALRHRIFNAKAYPAIKNRLSGVWFYR